MTKHTVKYNPSTKSCRLDELQPGEAFIILEPDERSEQGEWPDVVYQRLDLVQPWISPKSALVSKSGECLPCIILGKAGNLGNDGIIYQVESDTRCMRVTMDITLSPV